MKKMGAEKTDPMLNAISGGRGLCVGRDVDERKLLRYVCNDLGYNARRLGWTWCKIKVRGRNGDDKERKGRRKRERKKKRGNERAWVGGPKGMCFIWVVAELGTQSDPDKSVQGKEGPIAVRWTDINQIETWIEYWVGTMGQYVVFGYGLNSRVQKTHRDHKKKLCTHTQKKTHEWKKEEAFAYDGESKQSRSECSVAGYSRWRERQVSLPG